MGETMLVDYEMGHDEIIAVLKKHCESRGFEVTTITVDVTELDLEVIPPIKEISATAKLDLDKPLDLPKKKRGRPKKSEITVTVLPEDIQKPDPSESTL